MLEGKGRQSKLLIPENPQEQRGKALISNLATFNYVGMYSKISSKQYQLIFIPRGRRALAVTKLLRMTRVMATQIRHYRMNYTVVKWTCNISRPQKTASILVVVPVSHELYFGKPLHISHFL